MTGDNPSKRADGARAARLAEALRANLHRRKAQARALAAPDDAAHDPAKTPLSRS